MKMLLGAAAMAILFSAGSVSADPYKDYTPQKGAWTVTAIHVDPNHVDDYLTGLKSTWAAGQEAAKKRGIIDSYSVLVKMDGEGPGVNVLLMTHYPSLANMEPDRARDTAMMAEAQAAMSREKGEAMVAGFDKYRTFVGDGLYVAMDMAK